ncbi:MAG: tRNA (adenosine(37)-N6)-threonylcarbamoyltransferase complex dimerization subunit type 1 TsaB [Planctomycetota bacterium]|nr:tRNA (adenosine(37)-N6)-threonylcarbamoyltransferase complex dimerization subunit type 1 TsaB [Planctomycetota bacterium]MDA1178520.1 tRNA (adenosine(37)-N6)-threonylcarbamoyltransferase complex dimerization subunit type 1 TsaB [Planctomycetota bacterium]
MWTIAIETSTRSASVALLAPGGEIVQRALPSSIRTAVGLIPLLRDLLREQQLPPSELGLVAVGIGPGSFTGLRIGLTAAKTLAFAVGARLVGVNSLKVLAHQTAPRTGRLWTFIDGQRGDLVGTMWRHDDCGKQWRQIDSSARLLPRDDWHELLAPGDTVLACELRHPFATRDDIDVISGDNCIPQAAAVAQIGVACIELTQPVRESWKLRLDYYRPSAAEENRTENS